MFYTREDRINKEQEILSRWGWLVEDVEEYDCKLNTALVLENSYNLMVAKGGLPQGWLEKTLNEDSLNEAPMSSSSVGSNLIPKVLFPVIKRVFPQLIANKLISVQPIQAPTGVVYYITYTFSNTKGGITATNEYSANPLQTSPAYDAFYTSERIGPFVSAVAVNATDLTVATNAKTFFDAAGEYASPATQTIKRIEVYNATTGAAVAVTKVANNTANPGNGEVSYIEASGNVVIGNDTNILTAGTTYKVYVVYDQEGTNKIPEMEFSIGSQNVTTTERKLKIRWTKESEQDMQAYHKIDVEAELVKVASMEMNYEIDREILTFISDNITTNLSFTHDWTADSAVTGNNTSGNYLDRHRALAQKLHIVASKVAQYNRQGPASWAVVSPNVAACLKMLPDFKGEIAGGSFNIYAAGQLADSLDIYVDPNRVGDLTNEVLLGYKSKDTTYGAGVVYSPYTQWMSNTVTNPDNFNDVRGFFSRYALALMPRGQYFYARLLVDNLIG